MLNGPPGERRVVFMNIKTNYTMRPFPKYGRKAEFGRFDGKIGINGAL